MTVHFRVSQRAALTRRAKPGIKSCGLTTDRRSPTVVSDSLEGLHVEGPIPREELVDYWKRTRKKVLWATMLRHELNAALATDPVVLVPIGSVEQHGPACPSDVDISGAYAVAMRAAQSIEGFACLVAPPIELGPTPYNMGWVGTISLRVETAVALLRDICASLYHHGFRRIILVNGHGGNVPLMGLVATALSEENVYVGYTSIWDLGQEAMTKVEEKDGGRIGHGGEMETSIQLFLRPFLVDQSRAVSEPIPAMDPRYRHPRLGLIELQRETKTGVMGDGTAGNPEKGREFVDAAADNLVDVIQWFRGTERTSRGYADALAVSGAHGQSGE